MRLWQPEVFQGSFQKQKYFEGWYVKCVDATGAHSFAFIFGFAAHARNREAFIQMINGQTGATYYRSFPLEACTFSQTHLAVRIGENELTQHGLKVDVVFNDACHVQADLAFSALTTYPVTLTKPGIMGWYRYVPTMECYHGVVSRRHHLQGTIHFNETPYSFANGCGYIEKDWGSSMPKAWIWTQSNHALHNPTANYMLSIANIPWRKQAFTGFLGYVDTGTQLYEFATYTGAWLERVETDENGLSEIIIGDRGYWYHFLLWGDASRGVLQAPVFGAMDRQIHEAIQARAHVTIYERATKAVIFTSDFVQCGLERVGDQSIIETKREKKEKTEAVR